MNEDEMIYTVGDSLAYQFYCGNFSFSADQMIEDNISVNEFLEWLEDKAEELDYEDKLNTLYGGHFSNGFWLERKSSKVLKFNNIISIRDSAY